MSYSVALELIAICWGLGSAVFFSVGVLTIRKDSLKIISSSAWRSGEQIAVELAQQKVDFLFGATLLFLSFLLQLVVKLWALPVLGAFTQDYWLGAVLCVAGAFLTILCCIPFQLKRRRIAGNQAREFNA